MAERRYPLTRIRSGDYVVPSNDATQLWRINRYDEDGSLERDDGTRVVGTFWRACRWRGTMAEAEAVLERDTDEFLDWDRWVESASLCETRREALEALS